MHKLTSALATEPLPAEGFVLRKERARKAVKAPKSTEHRMKRLLVSITLTVLISF